MRLSFWIGRWEIVIALPVAVRRHAHGRAWYQQEIGRRRQAGLRILNSGPVQEDCQ